MRNVTQLTFPSPELQAENPRYLTEQLITYIGNKRALRGQIEAAVCHIRAELGGRKLRVLDAFSGSGVVSRLLKAHAELLVSNDIEEYATVISHCYLTNRSSVDWATISELVQDLNARAVLDSASPGYIERLYAPLDDDSIQPHERVFYTRDNARRLDTFAGALRDIAEPERTLLLGPLLSAASVHANTAGVFKGFYKDRVTGIGRFGGSGSDALDRIKRKITLKEPVLSSFECESLIWQMDANAIGRKGLTFDLVYVDPPYNQHPYGSNYFMLNLLVHYREPERISRVSGIPEGWRRSDYNVRSKSLDRFRELLCEIDSRYFLVSFNDEGFIAPAEMRGLLRGLGEVVEFAVPYNTFRGSRNLRERNIHVTEHLFLLRRT